MQGGDVRMFMVLVALVVLGGPSAAGSGAARRPVDRAGVVQALDVLHEWDARRARAWAHADPRELRSLYVPGSSAARSDVRLLQAYQARGLVVRRMVTQVFGVRVLRRDPGQLTLRVLDRVAGGRVDDGGRELALPSSRPVVRRIELHRIHGIWKVAAVGR
jgi:hypothetical protein